MIETHYQCSDGREFTSQDQAEAHEAELFEAWKTRTFILPSRMLARLDNTDRNTHHCYTDRELLDRCFKLVFDASIGVRVTT